jgi:cell division protein FtsL
MHRTINWVLMLAALAGTFALYAIKDGTRRLEARVQAQERALERAENDVSVLTAERAHLARPERLEPLARKLGMAPVSAGQYLRVEADAPSARVGEAGGASLPVLLQDGERVQARGRRLLRRLHRPLTPAPSPPGSSPALPSPPSPLAVWISECSSCLDPPPRPGEEESPLRARKMLPPSAR